MTATGPNSLPIVGSKGAPKKFRGRYDEVKPFLRHYERLCALKSVTQDRDKVENVTQYCSREVREFMEGLPSYRLGSWELFSRDVLKYFDAERDARRYRIKDLERYVQRTRRTPKFNSLATWKRYNRGYIRIAGWLVNKNKLDEATNSLYYWKGIPKSFRRKLETILTAHHPYHDLEEPWTREWIQTAAEKLLQRNRFDYERLPSDDESDSDYTDLDMPDSDDSDDSSDSDEEDKRKERKHKKKKKLARQRKLKAAEDSDEDETPIKQIQEKKEASTKNKKPSDKKKNDEEVEDLINKLNRMSVNDKEYAGLYLRACQINPMIKDVLESLAKQKQSQVSRRNEPSGRDNRAPPPGRTGARADMKCYGCGEAGHITARCPEIADYINKGIVQKDTASG